MVKILFSLKDQYENWSHIMMSLIKAPAKADNEGGLKLLYCISFSTVKEFIVPLIQEMIESVKVWYYFKMFAF